MFGLQTLDVIIGLIVVYLLLGLVCTAVNEWLSSLFSMKAKTLWTAVQTMIAKGEKFNPFAMFGYFTADAKEHKATSKTANFYAHPLIDTLSRKNQLPSYMSAETFRKVLLDVHKVHIPNHEDFAMVRATVSAIEDPKLNAVLSTFVNAAEGVENKVEHFNHQIETWFDECMDRATGWYKRQIQFLTFCFAAGVVVLFNVDSIEITRALWTSSALRSAFVEVSKEMVKYDNYDDMAKNMKVMKNGDKAELKVVQPDFQLDEPAAGETSDGKKMEKKIEKRIIMTDTDNDTSVVNITTETDENGQKTVETTVSGNPEAFGNPAKQEYDKLKTQLSIPIGWSNENWDEVYSSSLKDKALFIFAKLIGLFMSIAAASMGAPFWFNALKTVSNFRNGQKS